MDKLTTKKVTDMCFNCGCKREFAATYNKGHLVELACTECDTVDSFPLDEEDDYL